MNAKAKPRILCIDDEPKVLEGLALHLGRRFDVVSAGGGAQAIEAVQAEGAFAVVISDMRMPGMNGAQVLAKIRELRPDSVRMLLTGQADLESAISAVNEGQLFRFLTKPCPPLLLVAAVEAGVEQYRLITSERVLLEQTLHGSIKTLVDVLALTHPLPFGRAMRVKQLVSELAEKLALKERWQAEVAAMLSQLGAVALPGETVEKVFQGQVLSREEEAMVARMPAVTDQLLANIPRLELVRAILLGQGSAKGLNDADKAVVLAGVQLLQVASDFDTLIVGDNNVALAIGKMRGRVHQYGERILDALTELRAEKEPEFEVKELALSALRIGMVLAEDLRMTTGMLLVAHGYEITGSFLEKGHNFRPGTVKEPISVLVRVAKGH